MDQGHRKPEELHQRREGRAHTQELPQSKKTSIHSRPPEVYRCFNIVSITITGIIQMYLTSVDWTSKYNRVLIVKTRTVNILGRDISSKLRLALSQNPGKQINYINTDLSFKTKIMEQFPHLCTRIGKSKNNAAKYDIKGDIYPKQHIARRVPLQLTDKIDKEIKHLLDTKPIVHLKKCSDDVFLIPIVITVKH